MLRQAFWDRQRSESINLVASEQVIGHVSENISPDEPMDISTIPLLEANKEKYHEIWVVLTKKSSAEAQPVSFSEAVRRAIALGLVDSRTKTLDGEKYAVRFTKRKSRKTALG